MKLKSTIFTKYLRVLYKINTDKSNEVHTVIIETLYSIFVDIKNDINQANLEMCLKTATGVWLDCWGDYFFIPRELNEKDSAYADRIIAEVIEPKVTVDALKRATARFLNRKNGDKWTPDDVVLFEPWTGLMKLSHRGTLSASSRLWSPNYWSHGMIDLILPDASELTAELIAYLKTVKAAGVQIIWSITANNWDVVTDYWEVNIVHNENYRNTHLYVDDYQDMEGFRLSYGNMYRYDIQKGSEFLNQTVQEFINTFEGKTAQTLTIDEVKSYLEKEHKHLVDTLYTSLLSGDDFTDNWNHLYDSFYTDTVNQFVNKFDKTVQTLTLSDIKKRQWELYNTQVIDQTIALKNIRKYRLSGNFLIWREYAVQYWLYSNKQHSIKNYRNGETVKLNDYSLLFRKPLEEITLQEFYNQEFEDGAADGHILLNLTNSTIDDIAYFYPGTASSDISIAQIFQLDDAMGTNKLLIPGTTELHDSYCEDKLAYSQGLLKYEQQDNYHKYYEELRTVLTIALAKSILGAEATLGDIETNKTLLVKELIKQGLITERA